MLQSVQSYFFINLFKKYFASINISAHRRRASEKLHFIHCDEPKFTHI